MKAKMENVPELNYSITTIAGNSVVVVQAQNYETEIFTPQIVNGRITLLNIIPRRRCCQNANTSAKHQKIKAHQETAADLKENMLNSANTSRISCTPLANSTPAVIKRCKKSDAMILNSRSSVRATDTTLASPELVRRAVPTQMENVESSMFNLPTGVQISRIHHSPKRKMLTKSKRAATQTKNAKSLQNSANTSLLNTSFVIPCSPSILYNDNRISVKSGLTSSADSIARWQKVLTPVRTYTRKSNNPIMVDRPVKVRSAKKPTKPSKFVPTYLVNPTQGPKVTQHIEIKRRKLIIDGKLKISPKTFKKQQREPLKENNRKSFSLKLNSLAFSKPVPHLESMAMTAFDLLTNSNRYHHMAKPLNEQFRRGCLNKASSTYFKYKVLSIVPSLQNDDQVLDFSRL